MPLLGWEPGSTDPGESLSLWYLVSPMAFAIGAAAVLIAAGLAAWRAPGWAALAAGVAAILALPRLLLYDLTYLLVGADRNLDR
jgi:hypothetical protein